MKNVITFISQNKTAASALTVLLLVFALMAVRSIVQKKSPEVLAYEQCLERFEGVDESSDPVAKTRALVGISECYVRFSETMESKGDGS